MNDDVRDYLSGRKLYGDDLDQRELARWFQDEEYGYYRLAQRRSAPGDYEYHALNNFHGYRHLAGRRFRQCLALGCANGADVLPIAGQVDRFLAVEPAEQWWSGAIGQTPANYVKPNQDGSIPSEDGANDLVVCLGILHHIPNVSLVLSEISRVMAQGGLFLLREPIHTMGDWRRPRRGLTKNERGLPLNWLDDMLQRNRLVADRRALCMMIPIARISKVLGFAAPYTSELFVRADAALSAGLSWNLHYHRRGVLQRFAPSSIFYILRRT
jgi:SAM-dependent methyltransferase